MVIKPTLTNRHDFGMTSQLGEFVDVEQLEVSALEGASNHIEDTFANRCVPTTGPALNPVDICHSGTLLHLTLH